MPIVCPIIRLHFHRIINLILLIGSRNIPVHTACYSVCPTETNMHRTRRNWQKCVKNLWPEKNSCLLIFQSFSIPICHTRESKVNDQKLIVMRATTMRISRISHINDIARILGFSYTKTDDRTRMDEGAFFFRKTKQMVRRFYFFAVFFQSFCRVPVWPHFSWISSHNLIIQSHSIDAGIQHSHTYSQSPTRPTAQSSINSQIKMFIQLIQSIRDKWNGIY